jgi:hypothetical protein
VTRLLQRLFDPAYLYALNPGPLGRWGAVYLAWAALLLLGLGAAGVRWRRTGRAVWAATAGACALGLLAIALRLVAPRLAGLWPEGEAAGRAQYLLLTAWTARVWPLSATLLALALPLAHALSRRRLPPAVQRHVDALCGALASGDPPLPPLTQAALALAHLAGLALLWRAGGRPAWLALPALLLLALLPLLARPRRLRLETLTPLYPAYLSALAYLLLARRLGVDVDQYQGFALPDPWSPWFNVAAVVAAGVSYTLWIQVRLVLRGRGGRLWAAFRLPAALVLVTLLWLAATVVVHRTHGVTASDPYCYVQMAIDLARSGSPLHAFPLAGLARELGLPTWPAVHVGYHPPVFDLRSSTMWPLGWPLLMVPLYRLAGLEALYFAAPLAALLALLATWAMAGEALRGERPGVRWTAAALTCALVATSPEGAERILVPMADAAAQLFSVLTLWLLLRGRRTRPALHGLLAGVTFGAAYWIRHPQLMLGLAALVAALLPSQDLRGFPKPRRSVARSVALLLPFGLAALAVALPDLFYHRRVFGGWLHSESTEWFLLSARHVGSSFLAVLQQGLLRRDELGFLLPFVLYGWWRLARRHGRPAAVLGAGFLGVFLFHLCYAALRPRDLIAILPVLYLGAGYGFVVLWRRAERQRTPLAALALVGCAVLLLARSYRTLAMPWREDVITFGHVSAAQHEALDELRALTPADAVLGSMLNGGAIELHAGRAAVHPAPWSEEELCAWVEGLRARGRPFYVLDDGEEMAAVLERLKRHYRLQPVATLELPYFALGGGNLPLPARLYRVD